MRQVPSDDAGLLPVKQLRAALEAAAKRAELDALYSAMNLYSPAFPQQLSSPINLWLDRSRDGSPSLELTAWIWGDTQGAIDTDLRTLLGGDDVPLAAAPNSDTSWHLDLNGDEVPIRIAHTSRDVRPLHAWTAPALPIEQHGRALLELASPCDCDDRTPSALAGNAAHAAARTCLAMQDAHSVRDRAAIDLIADEMRQCALDAFRDVTVVRDDTSVAPSVRRRSARNNHPFSIRGARGYMVLEGDLRAAWPWLEMLQLWGAGGRRAYGCGRVRLWSHRPPI